MSPQLADYYAILQVHARAEQEVIDAAYRQLMRKYHPDLAGSDPAAAAEFHERAKAINQAYAVLRDPAQRQIYDRMRLGGAYTNSTGPPTAAQPTYNSVAAAVLIQEPPVPLVWQLIGAPFQLVAQLYNILPGRYEWEPGRDRELAATLLLTPLGVAGWLLATGRYQSILGPFLFPGLAVVAVLALLTLVLGASVPRILLASGPTLILASGFLDQSLRSVGAPTWLAWPAVMLVSTILSARMYLFGVLPAVGICVLLARVV
jgi:hypothetical protein